MLLKTNVHESIYHAGPNDFRSTVFLFRGSMTGISDIWCTRTKKEIQNRNLYLSCVVLKLYLKVCLLISESSKFVLLNSTFCHDLPPPSCPYIQFSMFIFCTQTSVHISYKLAFCCNVYDSVACLQSVLWKVHNFFHHRYSMDG